MLQTYALQKIIENLGHENIIIDYKCKAISDKYKPVQFYKFRNPIAYVKYLINYRKSINRIKLFNEFLSTHIKITEKAYLTKDSMIELNSIFDKFICGSDQIWNYNITNNDYAYLFDFVSDNRKKYSYAASFGFSRINSESIVAYKKLLSGFNKISVRESNAQNIIKDLLAQDCPVVLDPTLLLDKQDWYKAASKNVIFKKKYILIYILIDTDSVFDFAYKLSKMHNYEIVCIGTSRKKPNVTFIDNVGPSEWLNLFLHAEFIITNSFHGTIFSINFNKEFFVEMLPDQIDANSRFESVLNIFNLNTRRITNGDSSSINKKIDFESVNNILAKEREKSLNFLKNIVDSNE